MDYRSPVRLVAHAEEPLHPYAPQTISRARKKLLAELALQDNEMMLENVTYTRNDVITLLDGITSEEVWKHHCTVYTHQPLLDFVEGGLLDIEGFRKLEELAYNTPFRDFLAPYFATSFNAISSALIRQKNYDALASLMNTQGFITPEHSHEAYQRIRIYLDEIIHLLKNLSPEKYISDGKVLHFINDGCWISFLNKLPSSFASVRDAFVAQMLGLIYRFQRKASWYALHQCCLRLQDVECSEERKEQVNHYEEVMRKNVLAENGTPDTGSGKSGGSSLRMIFGVIWIIFILFRIGSSGGCNSSSSSTPTYVMSDEQQRFTRELLEKVQENEAKRNFRKFLSTLYAANTTATQSAPIKTGQPPFPSFSMLPPDEGNATITIRNSTAYDAVLLYFTDESFQLNSTDPVSKMLYSVYIKSGEHYTFRPAAGKGRYNFAFGRKWVKLGSGVPFWPERKSADLNDTAQAQVAAAALAAQSTNTVSIPAFFQNEPGLDQYYLTHDLVLSDYEPAKESTRRPLYAPPYSASDLSGKYQATLTLTSHLGTIGMEFEGNLYASLEGEEKMNAGASKENFVVPGGN